MAYPQFDQVPNHYAGPTIQRVKDYRLKNGKRSLCPTLLQIGQLQVLIPRHFGFCFGVERAIHMAFSALKEKPGSQHVPRQRDHPQPLGQQRPSKSKASASSTTPRGTAKSPKRR